MKALVTALALLALPLAACGGKGDDKLGDQAAQSADNRADALEATGESMEDQADAIRENGQDQEERIDDSDINAQALSNEQKGALVNGTAEPITK